MGKYTVVPKQWRSQYNTNTRSPLCIGFPGDVLPCTAAMSSHIDRNLAASIRYSPWRC